MSLTRAAAGLGLLIPILFASSSCSDSSGTDAAGPPAALEVLDGDEQHGTAGEELPDPLVVKVTDDRGRPVDGQLVNWRVTAGGGSVFAGSSITDGEGIVRERWTLGAVAGAAQGVEARAVDNATGAPLVFATFTAVAEAGPVTALAAVTTGTQEGTAGAALSTPLVVRASDQYGNPASGASVEWEASGGGSASPATSTADAEGEAGTTWTLGSMAGTQQLTARSGTATPVIFAATVRSGGVARLEVLSGDGRDGTVGLPLDEPLVLRALDALGNAVEGVVVAWKVRSGGGSVAPATSTTNSSGLAHTWWTLGMAAGMQTATASASGVEDASFTATAKAVPTGSLQWGVVAEGGSVSLREVWALSPAYIIGIGSDRRTVYRFDGSDWRTESIGVPTGTIFTDVWGSSSSEIYIVGNDGPGYSGIAYFDGSTWRNVTSAGYYSRSMIWGRGPGGAYVATSGQTYGGNMWQGSGMYWYDAHIGPYMYTSRPFYCPQADFVGGSVDHLFAADQCGGEYIRGNNGWVLTDIRRMAMWGLAGMGTYGVDAAGVWVWSGSGEGGSFVSLAGSPAGTSIWGTSGSDLFVAGDGIQRFDGSSWKEEIEGGSYLHIMGFSGSHIVAVGSDGRVVRGTR